MFFLFCRDRGGGIDEEEFKEFLVDVDYEWPDMVEEGAGEEDEEDEKGGDDVDGLSPPPIIRKSSLSSSNSSRSARSATSIKVKSNEVQNK